MAAKKKIPEVKPSYRYEDGVAGLRTEKELDLDRIEAALGKLPDELWYDLKILPKPSIKMLLSVAETRVAELSPPPKPPLAVKAKK